MSKAINIVHPLVMSNVTLKKLSETNDHYGIYDDNNRLVACVFPYDTRLVWTSSKKDCYDLITR